MQVLSLLSELEQHFEVEIPDYELRDVQVAAGADVAVAYGLAKMGGRGFALWFRTTVALREVEGRWLIAHVHESTPFYMDGSLRAAVDLTP